MKIVREFSFKIALVIFALTVLCTSCQQAQKKRPNFLFILVDDQSPFDLKTYDPNSILETPNIDKLGWQASKRKYLFIGCTTDLM